MALRLLLDHFTGGKYENDKCKTSRVNSTTHVVTERHIAMYCTDLLPRGKRLLERSARFCALLAQPNMVFLTYSYV